MIEVRLFATLREGREKIIFFEDKELSTGTQLLELLNIPEEDVAIFLINGLHNRLCKQIKDKDIVAIFPPVGGG